MKRILILGIALGAMLSFSSCEKENQALVPEDGAKMTLTATIEQPTDSSTKTSLGETVGKKTPVLWTKEDKIMVSNDNNQSEFSIAYIDKETQKAAFEGIAPALGNIKSAIYPSFMCMQNRSYIIIPATQTYIPENVAENTMPMYAQLTDESTTIEFKQLCGIVKLQITGTADQIVSEIKFSSDYKVAGTAYINYNEGDPVLAFDENGTKTITLDCGKEGVALSDSPTAFHIVVPPTKANTFSIIVTFKNGDKIVKQAPASDANKINRAKIKTMPPFNFEVIEDPKDYVDEYGINHGRGIFVAGVVWAPVNCGYKAKTGDTGEALGYPYGKLYQWGRKYGQGYVDDSYEDASYPNVDDKTLIKDLVSFEDGNSVENKNNFYYNQIGYDYCHDWCTETFTEWSKAKGNDPCPNGWRLPTKTELEALKGEATGSIGWDDTNKGYWLDGTASPTHDNTKSVFFCAAGHRDRYGTNSLFRAQAGYCWSSSVDNDDNTKAYFLSMLYYKVSINDYFRVYAYSVRCVQDVQE